MNTLISVIVNNEVQKRQFQYTLEPKKALIAFIQQNIKKNYNTSTYPKDMDNIKVINNNLGNRAYYNYIDNKGNDIVIGAIEQ